MKLIEKPYQELEGDHLILEENTKQLIKDKFPNCLCCDKEKKILLEVDHINPRYLGGNNDIDNLQTLCRYCNIAKNTLEIDFRTHITPLKNPPKEFKNI